MERPITTLFLSIALGLCVAACGDDTGGGECIDECAVELQTECGGTVILTCSLGADGCLDLVAGSDCATANETCDDTGGTAARTVI